MRKRSARSPRPWHPPPTASCAIRVSAPFYAGPQSGRTRRRRETEPPGIAALPHCGKAASCCLRATWSNSNALWQACYIATEPRLTVVAGTQRTAPARRPGGACSWGRWHSRNSSGTRSGTVVATVQQCNRRSTLSNRDSPGPLLLLFLLFHHHQEEEEDRPGGRGAPPLRATRLCGTVARTAGNSGNSALLFHVKQVRCYAAPHHDCAAPHWHSMCTALEHMVRCTSVRTCAT